MYQNVVKYGALDERQVTYETDLAVLVSKETSLPLSIVTSPWLRTLVLRRDPRIVHLTKRTQSFVWFRSVFSLVLPRNQIAKNSFLFLVYSKVYSCIVCLWGRLHLLVANKTNIANKTNMYFLIHTRTYTNRYACYQSESLKDLNGKTGLEHLTSLTEIKAWHLDWVPEMGGFGGCNHVYVSTWYVLWCRGWRKRGAHVYMGQQFDNLESTFLCEVYIKRFSSNQVVWPSASHTIFTCVSCVSIHVSTYVSTSTSC